MLVDYILYKGKTKANNTWIEGLPCYNIYKQLCIQPLTELPCQVIDRDTLCRYITLEDMSGNKLFDGDLIRFTRTGFPMLIRWDREDARFVFHDTINNVNIPIHKVLADQCELLGNIFDNPDLLEANDE